MASLAAMFASCEWIGQGDDNDWISADCLGSGDSAVIHELPVGEELCVAVGWVGGMEGAIRTVEVEGTAIRLLDTGSDSSAEGPDSGGNVFYLYEVVDRGEATVSVYLDEPTEECEGGWSAPGCERRTHQFSLRIVGI